jgi:hypothetical protein
MTCTLHVWMASHLHIVERLEYIQYAFQSLVDQSRKPDSVWLSVSCVAAFVPEVRQLREYFSRVAESWGIECHIFLQPHRLAQFEHYHHIWSEFRKVDHKYSNPYITFSDDDDLSHPERLATFVASSYSPFVPTFCQLAHFTDESPARPARSVDEVTNAQHLDGIEYVTSFCSLFLLNRYFPRQCHLDLQRHRRFTDLLFLSFIRGIQTFFDNTLPDSYVAYTQHNMLAGSYHYFARQNRCMERAY